MFTPLDPRPVLMRANLGRVRVRGLETSVQAQVTEAVFARAYFSYLRGVDVQRGGPPEVEGGLPPANGYLSVRWQPGSRPFWIETYSHLAWRQSRLSSLELSDQRIGAMRSRAAIAAFFHNGAAARGLVARWTLASDRGNPSPRCRTACWVGEQTARPCSGPLPATAH